MKKESAISLNATNNFALDSIASLETIKTLESINPSESLLMPESTVATTTAKLETVNIATTTAESTAKSTDTTESIITQRLLNGENIAPLLKSATLNELAHIAQIIRTKILEVVSKNGGHLSSTLGAVELIIGMHAAFECEEYPFIFDVSHQIYAHKLLTGRFKDFHTLRQTHGISGFASPKEMRHGESAYDYFIAGHSSTSLSLGVGVSKAQILNGSSKKPIIMIGDGSMSAGLVYEALNEIGERKLPMVVILNDNEMSIAKPIGAISKILSKSIASPFYQSMKKQVKKIIDKMPDGAAFIARRFEESLKLITPGLLFEEFGLDYIGPIDGHNLDEIIKTLRSVKNMHQPVLIHAQTIKGRGYKIAEGKYEKWHGVAPFDLDSGKTLNSANVVSPTATFSNKLLEMARTDSKIVGVTAAMPSGTGLDKLMDTFPDRFYDVAIAEQHAVTSMASMAKEGFKPYIAIYSTFLQRAFDQIVHDICIMNLPVVFCIDRAGLVGEDGETHQGLLDISYLKALPNITLIAPRSNKTLESYLEYSRLFNSPLAIRYPRGKFLWDVSSLMDKFQNLGSESLESWFNSIKSEADSKNFIGESQKLFKGAEDSKNHNFLQPQMIINDILWSKLESKDNFDSMHSESLKTCDVSPKISSPHKILLIGYGNGVGRGLFTLLELYKSHNIKTHLLDLVCLKPIDSEMLAPYFEGYDFIFVLSDSYKINGVGSSLITLANELFVQSKIKKIPKIITFEIEDRFIKHGKTEEIEQILKLDSISLAKSIASSVS